MWFIVYTTYCQTYSEQLVRQQGIARLDADQYIYMVDIQIWFVLLLF